MPSCQMFQARIGWPYYQFTRGGKSEWHSRLAPDIALEKWKFYFTPSFPDDRPATGASSSPRLLFLYAYCDDGTGVGTEKPCEKRTPAIAGDFLDWVRGRKGSAAIRIDNADHWFAMRSPMIVNKHIAKFLGQDGTSSPDEG